MKAEFDMLELRAALEAVLPAVSTDEERPGLNSLCLDTTKGPRSIGTDGHWIAEYTMPTETVKVEEPGRIAISLRSARKVLAMLDGDVGTALVVSDKSLVRFELERVGRVDCHPVDGFPPTDGVWPVGDGKSISRTGMSPKLLARIGKAFSCKKENGLHFVFFGPNAPILINSESLEQMRVALMPLRQLEIGFP